GHGLAPPGAHNPRNWIEQHVIVRALEDDHLVGASIPVARNVSEPVLYDGQGVARVLDGLQRDERYTIWSYSPRPTPAQLVRVPAVFPAALTRPGRELELGYGGNAPPFGAAGRDSRMFR